MSDTTDALYQRWLALGNLPTTTPTQTELTNTLLNSTVPIYINSGLQIVSDASPALNGTYAIDPATMASLGSLARDVASGMGFPLGTATYVYNDLFGGPHTFTTTQFTSLYIAMRNYLTTLNIAVTDLANGNFASLPPQPQTIA